MILCYVFNVQTETANWARDSCLKNIIKNHNGQKFQNLMGRNFCVVMVRSQKQTNAKAEETNFSVETTAEATTTKKSET